MITSAFFAGLRRNDRAVPDGIPDGLGSMWALGGIDGREVKHLVVVRRKS